MKEYQASGGGGGTASKEKKKETKRKESTPKSSPTKSGTFKSKEYISDADTSSSSENDDKGGKEKKSSNKPQPAKKPVCILRVWLADQMARINMERGTEKQRLPIFGCQIYVQGDSFARIFVTVQLNSSINH